MKTSILKWLMPSIASIAVGFGSVAQASQVDLDVTLGTPVMLAGKKQTAYLKVSLTGFELEDQSQRTPVNIAVVMDKSGSMGGEKIRRAREAAIMAIERLNTDDIAAVVTYDHLVEVITPATKVLETSGFRKAIQRINAGGNTALFAGVSKGAHEIRKFLDRNRVNRVILLSDGLANVGPSSPAELGRLGASLGKEGISVSTIGLGLGYNEDLMTRLAGLSDGNHAFVENAHDLARIFDAEFGDVLSVVAQEVQIRIHCAPGIRPVRVLGRDAEVEGQRVYTSLNQLYSQQEKFVLLEVEVAAGEVGKQQDLGSVEVSYTNTLTRATDQLSGATTVSFSASEDRVVEATDGTVMTATVEQVANQMSKDAVQLRDEGKVKEARSKLEESAAYVQSNAQRYRSQALQDLSAEITEEADDLEDEASWNRTRKALRKKQYKVDTQQSY